MQPSLIPLMYQASPPGAEHSHPCITSSCFERKRQGPRRAAVGARRKARAVGRLKQVVLQVRRKKPDMKTRITAKHKCVCDPKHKSQKQHVSALLRSRRVQTFYKQGDLRQNLTLKWERRVVLPSVFISFDAILFEQEVEAEWAFFWRLYIVI